MRKRQSKPFEYKENLTPYDVIRMQNAKTFKYRKDEMYPSIRPPISHSGIADTAEWLADAMEVSGLERPKFYIQPPDCPYVEEPIEYKPKALMEQFKYMCKPRKQPRQELHLTAAQRALDWNNMTPTDLMRMQNCKPFEYQECEKYPSIRPIVSPCNPILTAEWLADSVETSGCNRLFDMELDDIVEVWKRTPKKESLSYYGVGAGIQKPEAIEFNQVISKCLDIVSSVKPKEEVVKQLPRERPMQLTTPMKPKRGNFVLNRRMLEKKIGKMPTVQQKLHPSQAFTWMHCPRQRLTQPFVAGPPGVPMRKALDMEKLQRRPQHGLRRKHPYCELQCGIEANKCTDYEWMKFKSDQAAYEEAFKRELESMREQTEPEPKNYDELYTQLVSCFQKTRRKDPLKETYLKYCGDEDTLFGGTGTGKGGKEGKGGKGYGTHGSGYDDDYDSWDSQDAYDGFDFEGEEEEEGDGDTDGKTYGKGGGKGKGKGHKGHKGKGKGKGKDDGKGKGDNKFPDSSRNDQSEYDHPPLVSKTSPMEDPFKTGSESGGKGKKPDKGKKPKKVGTGSGSGRPKDCPCEVCDFMKRRELEPDSPLITQLKREEKRRQLRDYLKLMCHRQYVKFSAPEYPAPPHKCDPIECDNCFCTNPKLSQYCDCLNAMQELHKLLGAKHQIVNNELLFNVKDLRDRVCQRFCECL